MIQYSCLSYWIKLSQLFLGSPPWLWQVSVSFFIPRLQFAIFKEQVWSIGSTCVHHLVNWDTHTWLQFLAAVNIRAIQSGVHLSLELLSWMHAFLWNCHGSGRFALTADTWAWFSWVGNYSSPKWIWNVCEVPFNSLLLSYVLLLETI